MRKGPHERLSDEELRRQGEYYLDFALFRNIAEDSKPESRRAKMLFLAAQRGEPVVFSVVRPGVPVHLASQLPEHSPKQLCWQVMLTPRSHSLLHVTVQLSVQVACAGSVHSWRHTVCSLVAQAFL